MSFSPGLLAASVRAVDLVLPLQHPADRALSQFFRDNRALGQQDRGFVADTAYLVLRHLASLKHVSPRADAKHLTLAALALYAGRTMRELEPHVRDKEHTWLVALKGEDRASWPLGAQLELPDWLIARLQTTHDASELMVLARALNTPAPLDLRVNVLKGNRDAAIATLAEDGITAVATPYSPLGLRVTGKPALQKTRAFEQGLVEVQDEGSQLIGLLLEARRGEMAVDFCAGAGGKTLLIAEQMRNSGRVYAFDVSDSRLAKLTPRLARSGVSNIHPQRLKDENDTHVKRLAGKIDRVLVDAPCTGLGTLRRNPDLKWRQTEQSVVELVAKQTAILASAARLVKPGGRLVYATCSLLREENEDIVDAFLAKHPQFEVVPVRDVLARSGIALDDQDRFLKLNPATHNTDGFFAAVLTRVPQAA